MSDLTNRPGKPIRRPDRRHTAGVLDIRNIIGGLLATYGVILVLVHLFGDSGTEKTGDVNANLWAGLALLVGGGGVPPLGVAQAAHGARVDTTSPDAAAQGGSTAE